MNIERLEMMRVMMERVVAGSWEPDQSIFAEVYRPTSLPLEVNKVNLHSWREPSSTQNVCGYSACAVGHACFDEEFRKLGMRWVGSAPYFGDKGGWDGVRAFFEVDKRTSELLFGSFGYDHAARRKYEQLPVATREAKMVADRIESLIKNGKEQFLKQHGY